MAEPSWRVVGQGIGWTDARRERVRSALRHRHVGAEPLHWPSEPGPCAGSRRGGRVAEGTRLLSEYGEAISIAGSNPALSAARRLHCVSRCLAPVAQLDRVTDYESVGQRFESSRARRETAGNGLVSPRRHSRSPGLHVPDVSGSGRRSVAPAGLRRTFIDADSGVGSGGGVPGADHRGEPGGRACASCDS